MEEKYGIYLFGDKMATFDTATEAYEAAQFAEEETGIFHEVREVN